ncbi:MAG: TorF family putative porin [Gammaproteobacteria bacterium]|nr:TorF family putative porin [Gammaproteobacteria bacterium]
MINLLRKQALSLSLGASCLLASMTAFNAQADVSVSGNVGVVSKYVLRGMQELGGLGPESNSPAMQGGFDLSAGGFYAGYWGSNLSYSDGGADNGFENDLYAGYGLDVGGVSLSAGLIQYFYVDITNFDGLEFDASASYGPAKVRMQYLAKNVIWGNKGDIYFTASYGTEIIKGFNLDLVAGFYTYNDDDASNPFMPDSATAITSGFRHLNVSLSHAIGKTGATMSLTGIYGGQTRDDETQGSTVVMGLNYGFDI